MVNNATGPYKAWPENAPTNGEVYLVRGKDPRSICCARFDASGSSIHAADHWQSVPGDLWLYDVTHYAKLERKAP